MSEHAPGPSTLGKPTRRLPADAYTHISAGSFFLACYLCCLVLILTIAPSGRFVHWFVLPVWMCGVLVVADAIDWFRGRLNVFDPIGVLGPLGLHFFFVAPLVHVYSDYWMSSVSAPGDWRDWLGGMAALNFMELLVYRFTRTRSKTSDSALRSATTLWLIDHRRCLAILPLALVLTGSLQVGFTTVWAACWVT